MLKYVFLGFVPVILCALLLVQAEICHQLEKRFGFVVALMSVGVNLGLIMVLAAYLYSK